MGLTLGGAAAAVPDDGYRDDDGAAVSASIPGVVVDHDNQPWLGAIVQLYTSGPNGEAVEYLRPAFSDQAGRWEMSDLEPGCYVIIVEAPAAKTFTGDMLVDRHRICVEPGRTAETVVSTLAGPPEPDDPGQGGGTVFTAADPRFSVELIHLGQHQGRLAPSTAQIEVDGITAEVEVGGWPRLVTALQAEQVGNRPESTVFAHTGGVLGGGPLSRVFGGAADAALMNRVCFDLVATGPGDIGRAATFDTFVDFLADGPCDTTILAPGELSLPDRLGPAADDPLADLAGTALHRVGNEAVAFVSVARTSPSGAIVDPLATASARIEALLDRGYDAIILISSLGASADRLLVPQLPAVDAVLGQADLSAPADTLTLSLDRPPPRFELNADGDPVCFGWPGPSAVSLGRLQIDFDAGGRVIGCDGGTTILLGQEVAVIDEGRRRSATAEERRVIRRAIANDESMTTVRPDAGTARALANWARALDLLMDEPVAELDHRLCRTSIPGRSVGVLCSSGDTAVDVSGPRDDAQQLVTDAFRHAAGRADQGDRDDRDDQVVVGLISSATVGQGLEPGTTRLHDAFRLVPGDRHLIHVTLTGAELVQVLEEALAGAIDGEWNPAQTASDEMIPAQRPGAGAYPHTSGLRWKPDFTRPAGRRVGSVQAARPGGTGWEDLDPDTDYLVVTTEALVVGDRAYPTLRAAAADGRASSTSIGGAEAVLDYIEQELGGVIPSR